MKSESIQKINALLNDLKLDAFCTGCTVKTRCVIYDISLLPSGRVKSLKNAADEISLRLRTKTNPTFELDRENGLVKMKVRLNSEDILYYKNMSKKNVPSGDLPVLIGETESGDDFWMDLSKNPHMLVAGTTGSGKSSLLHVIINNCIERKSVNISIIDPKGGAEFSKYKDSTDDVATSYEEAIEVLEELHGRMEVIYATGMKKNKSTVLIVDEVAELMDYDRHPNNPKKGEFEKILVSLAQKARAAKIYIILATQRPDSKVITGRIKANFPARLACRVNSAIDSKIILDDKGAENLLGAGDAIVKLANGQTTRLQLALA